MKPGTDIFLHVPVEGKPRVLHRATLVETLPGDRPGYRLEMARPIEVAPGRDLLCYFETSREFLQQPVCVSAVPEVPEDSDVFVIELETTGDPVSAESRQQYRVTTVGVPITAVFDGEDLCPVLDVSASGLSLKSYREAEVGDRVRVTLRFEGFEVEGTLVIHGVTDSGRGQFRYGGRCVDGPLAATLPRINMKIQNLQLRRRSGLDH